MNVRGICILATRYLHKQNQFAELLKVTDDLFSYQMIVHVHHTCMLQGNKKSI